MSISTNTDLQAQLADVEKRITRLESELGSAKYERRRLREQLRGGVVWVILESTDDHEMEIIPLASSGRTISKKFELPMRIAIGDEDSYLYEARFENGEEGDTTIPFSDRPRVVAWEGRQLNLRAYQSPEEAAEAIARGFNPKPNRWTRTP